MVAYTFDARQRWLPTWWAVRLLVQAGSEPAAAVDAVDDVHQRAGRTLASRRLLPVAEVRELLGELLDYLDEE